MEQTEPLGDPSLSEDTRFALAYLVDALEELANGEDDPTWATDGELDDIDYFAQAAAKGLPEYQEAENVEEGMQVLERFHEAFMELHEVFPQLEEETLENAEALTLQYFNDANSFLRRLESEGE